MVNYLAHAYLSFGIPAVVTGNMISDFVKGRRKFDLPVEIRTGISLHRAIDNYTDAHASTRRAKSFFRNDYGLYSGPLTDIVYDHFLAADPGRFPAAADLSAFAAQTYRQLAGHSMQFPERFARLFPFMRDQDWLSGYRQKAGIFASFGGLARRASYMPPPDRACHLFESHFSELQDCYRVFFPELSAFAAASLAALLQEEGSGKIG